MRASECELIFHEDFISGQVKIAITCQFDNISKKIYQKLSRGFGIYQRGD